MEALLNRGHNIHFVGGKHPTKFSDIECTLGIKRNELNTLSITDLVRSDFKDFDVLIDATSLHLAANKYQNEIPVISFTHGMGEAGPGRAVAISHDQAAKWGKNVDVVYPGIETPIFSGGRSGNNYLLFLGKLAPWKGLKYFVELCKKTNSRGIIAGPMFSNHEEYVKPLLEEIEKSILLSYVGVITGSLKDNFIKDAGALVFPTLVREAFGLVMLEAMKFGTPVLTWDIGPTREILGNGKGGYISPSITLEGLIEGVPKVLRMNRKKVYNWATKFTVNNMADSLERTLKKAISTFRHGYK